MTAAAGNKNSFTRLIAVVLTGILAGLSGMVLALILHAIQHLAFGYSPWADRERGVVSTGRHGFLLASSHLGHCGGGSHRRVSAGGCLDAMGRSGFQLRRRWLTLPCQCLRVPQRFMLCCRSSPWRWALRFGREVAPREMGALGAGMVARKLGLTADETRTLVACGAGAGLAAVYNVPLAGALFSLEVMLLSFSWEKTLAAIITSAIAAWTANARVRR
ncbi:chloride transporter, chloride channel (ClC) family protein [Klebsiella grimontii]|uniref:Chloride transporter, chloride channel (ClC) family protein n=1 Tax=Klebsiella grimontii TaxID=2058152 RepID=A0A7H4NUG7_9ENTR|nr:chloride transporter, chloride channel (ClC) family protein [Klebsiella grimontii]